MTNAAARRVTTPPQPLTASDVQHFLAKYKSAWETRNPGLAASLFTRDAEYKPDPFGATIAGREAIHDYWATATAGQEEIHFDVRTVIQSGYLVAVEWTCTHRSNGEKNELAGIFLADFYGKQVRRFREYRQSRPN